MPTDLVLFEYDGSEVIFDSSAEHWNLNAMHRAVGGAPNKAPAQWLRNQHVQDLIAALAERENCANSHSLLAARSGRTGGTWAHWQIAAAYAHYLSPRFYLQWNEWAMAYRRGGAPANHQEARLVALEQQTSELLRRLAALEAPPALPALPVPIPSEVETTAVLADRLADSYWQAGKPLTIRALAEAFDLTIGGARMHFMRIRHAQRARWEAIRLRNEAGRGAPCIALRPRRHEAEEGQ